MIDYLIHAYRRGADPFQSLSALSDMEAMHRKTCMLRRLSSGKDPAQYLQARRQVEQWLRREFIAKGGRPQAPYPIYMVLGRSKWIQTMLDATTLATAVQIEVPLSIFRECDASFTYPDSILSQVRFAVGSKDLKAPLRHRSDQRHELLCLHSQTRVEYLRSAGFNSGVCDGFAPREFPFFGPLTAVARNRDSRCR